MVLGTNFKQNSLYFKASYFMNAIFLVSINFFVCRNKSTFFSQTNKIQFNRSFQQMEFVSKKCEFLYYYIIYHISTMTDGYACDVKLIE